MTRGQRPLPEGVHAIIADRKEIEKFEAAVEEAMQTAAIDDFD